MSKSPERAGGVFRLLFASLLLIAGIQAFEVSMPESRTEASALVDRLREGGYIIYMRHSYTEHNQSDRTQSDFGNCALQRNLSRKGREVAAEIGKALKKAQIPIGRVLCSPYCRCRDTAKLAFGRCETDRKLRFALVSDREETQKLKEHLRTLLLQEPKPGTNTVLVSHTANLKEAAGIWPKPEAVMEIFRKISETRIEYVGRITPDFWRETLSRNDAHPR